MRIDSCDTVHIILKHPVLTNIITSYKNNCLAASIHSCSKPKQEFKLYIKMKLFSNFQITEVPESLSYSHHDLFECQHSIIHAPDCHTVVLKRSIHSPKNQIPSNPNSIPYRYKNKIQKQIPNFLQNNCSFYSSHLTKQRIFYYSAYPR